MLVTFQTIRWIEELCGVLTSDKRLTHNLVDTENIISYHRKLKSIAKVYNNVLYKTGLLLLGVVLSYAMSCFIN